MYPLGCAEVRGDYCPHGLISWSRCMVFYIFSNFFKKRKKSGSIISKFTVKKEILTMWVSLVTILLQIKPKTECGVC